MAEFLPQRTQRIAQRAQRIGAQDVIAFVRFVKTLCPLWLKKGDARRFKSESLADNGARRNTELVMFRKTYSLEFIVRPIRRALPYANMRKAFSLLCQHALIKKSSVSLCAFSVKLCVNGLDSFETINMVKGCPLSLTRIPHS